MGTSHHEPMTRSWAEWERYGEGEWNYSTNREKLLSFWKDGIQISKDYEKLVTIGMRGDGDEPMMEDGSWSSRWLSWKALFAISALS